jgi:hypothetical protein
VCILEKHKIRTASRKPDYGGMEKLMEDYKEQKVDYIQCRENELGFLTPVKVVEAVKCCECDNLLPRTSEDYFTFRGNLLVGEHGGVLGNGEWRRNGIPVYHFCLNGCFSSFIQKQEQAVINSTPIKQTF